MPSASSKSEKPASTEATDPLRQAIVIIEHKIRNLEKRKSRLDTYKESAKPLTKEQVEAVSKYQEVIQQLELSKEYVKQFTCISTENEKLKKRNARKEAQERSLADINKIKHVLLIQDVLQNMGGETVQEDFLAGRNGAVQLTEEDLRALNDLYGKVTLKRAAEEGVPPITDQLQKAAEHFLAIIEGKQKEMVGTTYAKLKQLVTTINTCGYFDQPAAEEETGLSAPAEEVETETPEEEEFHETQEIASNVIVPTQNVAEGNLPPAPPAATMQPLLPGAPVLPAGVQPPLLPANQHILPPNVQSIVPTPVSQVESSFFNAQGFKPPTPQSVVPPPAQNTGQINDVIQGVGGKFNFLQESEIEINDMNPVVVAAATAAAAPNPLAPQVAGAAASAIPTRTFTNQNFNGQPSGGPNYPPNYPPQPAAYQTFVPGISGFMAPNTSPTPNNNATSNNNNTNNNLNTNNTNNTTTATNNNTNNNTNSNNNIIPNPIPMPPTRNPNVSYNQGQQQITNSGYTQPNTQTGSQPPGQAGFPHGGIASLDNAAIEDTVRTDSDRKEKPEDDNQDWSQKESMSWADDRADTNEWNQPSGGQTDGSANQNKFSSGRVNRNGARNTNGFQGNRNRNSRQGGYRDSQNNQGGGGSSNYYPNQNGYQSRNDRINDYSTSGKVNSEFRDNTFKERGDFNNRDREPRENYGSGIGYRRGPSNRGPNSKGPPLDRGDRQGQAPRNPGGPRPQRNMTRPAGSGNGPSYQRQQPNQGGQASK